MIHNAEEVEMLFINNLQVGGLYRRKERKGERIQFYWIDEKSTHERADN